ncbi:hypothetical protein, partial [Enorma massiliensis]|uniref:hypothetical protein n=1 Tax=Enorma massiliensis TaxID=1472761 RepID=UPI003A8DA82A
FPAATAKPPRAGWPSITAIPEKNCPRGARFYKYLLRKGAKLCYNLSENALAPIRAALSPMGMPSGDEAQGGKNKEGTPQWQSFP